MRPAGSPMSLPLPRRNWVRVALLVPPIAVVLVLLWWRGPSIRQVADAFTIVDGHWVVAAIGLNLLSVAVRVLAWDIVIRQAVPPPRPRLRYVFSGFCVGLLANAILPGRIGELARVAVVSRRLASLRGAWATLIGTVFAHRVFDLVPALILFGYVLQTAKPPEWAVTSLTIAAAVGLGLFAFAFVSARRHHTDSPLDLGTVNRLVRMARHGLGVMHAPIPAAGAVFFQCLAWTLQLLAVYAALVAFQIDASLAAAGLVLLLMNVATIFPLWPGNVGLVQATIALPLVSYGVAYPHGFAFGIGVQAIEVAVGVSLGLAFLAREGLSIAMLKVMPDAAEAEVPDEAPVVGKEARARAGVPG